MKNYFELWIITDFSFNIGFLKNEIYLYMNSIGYLIEKTISVYIKDICQFLKKISYIKIPHRIQTYYSLKYYLNIGKHLN